MFCTRAPRLFTVRSTSTLALLALTALSVLALLPILPAGRARAAGPLSAFVADYGDPPQASEGRLRIPSIEVDAPIGAQVVGADGESPMPLGPSDVAWYDFGSYTGLGGVPGDGHNAIFSGHVDYVARVPWAGARYSGPGVFARLGELAIGDRVEVVRGGATLIYVVVWSQHLDAEATRWGEYWNASVLVDSITLYTCSGDFDPASISYSDRVIVRAERLVGTPRVFPQTWGDYTAGVSGTNLPSALAVAQPFPVHAIWKQDLAVPTGYRFWAPGVPTFLDTLSGHLTPQDYVIMRIRQGAES